MNRNNPYVPIFGCRKRNHQGQAAYANPEEVDLLSSSNTITDEQMCNIDFPIHEMQHQFYDDSIHASVLPKQIYGNYTNALNVRIQNINNNNIGLSSTDTMRKLQKNHKHTSAFSPKSIYQGHKQTNFRMESLSSGDSINSRRYAFEGQENIPCNENQTPFSCTNPIQKVRTLLSPPNRKQGRNRHVFSSKNSQIINGASNICNRNFRGSLTTEDTEQTKSINSFTSQVTQNQSKNSNQLLHREQEKKSAIKSKKQFIKRNHQAQRVLTVDIANLEKWNQHFCESSMIYELVGILDSTIPYHIAGVEKRFTVKDSTSSIRCVFWEIDRKIQQLRRGSLIRCVGMYKGTIFHCVSVRSVAPSEENLLKKLKKQCETYLYQTVKSSNEA